MNGLGDKGKKVSEGTFETPEKWVRKPGISHSASALKAFKSPVGSPMVPRSPVIEKSSDAERIGLATPSKVLDEVGVDSVPGSPNLDQFPIPPDWEDLNKKARKKLQKIWFNKMRSRALLAARESPSSCVGTH